MNIYARFSALYLSLVLYWLTGCKTDAPPPSSTCSCPIEMPHDIASTQEKQNSQNGYSIQSENSIAADIQPKIKAKIQLTGGYSQSETLLREVYTEILPANPNITQKAMLFRGVACAYYSIVCKDSTLSQSEKNRRMAAIVEGYEKNLKEILAWTKMPIGNSQIATTTGHKSPLLTKSDEPVFTTIPVLIFYSKVLIPRIILNGERLECRDTTLSGHQHAWFCNTQQYPGKNNELEIQDRHGITQCKEEIGPITRPYQTIYPCL